MPTSVLIVPQNYLDVVKDVKQCGSLGSFYLRISKINIIFTFISFHIKRVVTKILNIFLLLSLNFTRMQF